MTNSNPPEQDSRSAACPDLKALVKAWQSSNRPTAQVFHEWEQEVGHLLPPSLKPITEFCVYMGFAGGYLTHKQEQNSTNPENSTGEFSNSPPEQDTQG